MSIQVSHQKLWTSSNTYVKKMYPLKIGIKEEEKFGIMDHILNNETELTRLKMMMSMIVGMKCNKYPVTCK